MSGDAIVRILIWFLALFSAPASLMRRSFTSSGKTTRT